jgi:hypothetical protein
MAEVEEPLPSVYKALSSNLSHPKEKEKKKPNIQFYPNLLEACHMPGTVYWCGKWGM